MSKQNQSAYASGGGVMPIRRDLHFRLPADQVATWNKECMHISHFMNALSIFFPVGERFFIDSVRNYQDEVTDPELVRAVKSFIGQEAMHGREHEEYNDALFARVPATAGMERLVVRFLKLGKLFPRSLQLSGTIALEHFTAVLADGLLAEPRFLGEAEPHYARLWQWHALEETEHKSVAFDVWLTVQGSGPLAYIQRMSGLLGTGVSLTSLLILFYLRILYHERQLTNLAGWRMFGRYAIGEVGMLRKMVRPWADYFRPSFHPWDHDNRHLLERLQELVEDVERAA